MKNLQNLLLAALLAGVLAPWSSALAQPKFSGYYEHTVQLDYVTGGDETLLDLSKLRLDLEAGNKEGLIGFRGNVNFRYYHSDVTYDITPFLPDPVVADLRAREAQFGSNPLLAGQSTSLTRFQLDRERIWLDNAFLTWHSDHWRFRAGYQQLSWGPGYSTNPTDLFHRKLLVDPSYEKEGVPALRLDYRWGIGGELSAIMAPNQRLESAGYALRLANHIAPIGFDVALTGHAIVDSTSLREVPAFPPNQLMPNPPLIFAPRQQDRYALGLDFVGSLLGLGVWSEGNWNWMEAEQDFARVVAGIDYTFMNGLYVMAEALYNGRSQWETPYPTIDWMENLYFGEPVGPGWVMLGASREITALSEGMLYTFISPLDGSVMLNPRLEVSIAQNASLSSFASITLGEKGGQFPPGAMSLYTRIQVYY